MTVRIVCKLARGTLFIFFFFLFSKSLCSLSEEMEEIQLRVESELKLSTVPIPKPSADSEAIFADLTIEPEVFKKLEVLVQDVTRGEAISFT